MQEALGRLMHGRTTIIIAHRLSTVQIANRIAVLDKGNLVELGTHDELMARAGLYNRLYSLQFALPEDSSSMPGAGNEEALIPLTCWAGGQTKGVSITIAHSDDDVCV